MKTLIIALCLTSTIVFAQIPAPLRPSSQQGANAAGEVLPENYLLTLTVSDKDQLVTELSLVVASADFKAEVADPVITFTGTLTPDDKEGILMSYGLGTQVAVPSQVLTTQPPSGAPVTTSSSIQYRSSSVQATVKVRVGEPLNILKSGTRSYKLTISRLSEGTHKNK
jgi:hypothetical protein